MKKKIKVFLQKNNLSFLITKTRYIRFFHFFIVGYYLLKRKKPIRVHGGLFFFPEKTNAINIGKYFFGFYERSEFRLIKKFIEPSDVVLELGANIGIMSNIINDLLLNKKIANADSALALPKSGSSNGLPSIKWTTNENTGSCKIRNISWFGDSKAKIISKY